MHDINEMGANKHLLENDRPPRSKAQLTFTIILWLVIILLLLAIFSPVREAVVNHFTVKAPTPTIADGGDLIAIQAYPLGTVTIDGHAISETALLNAPHSKNVSLELSRGKHKIVWQAPPFLPLSCIISIPPQANEQCNYKSSGLYVNYPGSRLITFNATMADLPASRQATLKKAIQATLNSLQSTETVHPGENYAYTPSAIPAATRTAAQPFQATLHVHLDMQPEAKRSCDDGYSDICTSNGQSCLQLCTNTNVSVAQPKNGLAWDINALYYNTWTYATQNGQIVAQNQPDTTSPVVGQDHSIELHVTWDSKGWHVSTPPYTAVLYFAPALSSGNVPLSSNPVSPACSSIHNQVNSMTPSGNSPYGAVSASPPINVDWGFTVGANEAAGCLGVVVPAPDNAQMPVNFKQPAAYFLYRFGTLVAVNALAHKDFPGVPLADAYEQTIAQSIMRKLKY